MTATEALVVLARVRAGEADAARAAIEAHWPAGGSPFAAAGGTHLARLQIVTPPARPRHRAPGEHLLLAADVDAPLDAWIERLRARPARLCLPPLRLLPRRRGAGRVRPLGGREPAVRRFLGDRRARRDARGGRGRARPPGRDRRLRG